ncbi:MAG: M23 family metallopeptidase [Patescibacteria group bacterium]
MRNLLFRVSLCARINALWAFALAFLLACAPPINNDTAGIDTAGNGFIALGKTTATNGFTYPLSTETVWDNDNYGACGSSYYTGYCHTGNDMVTARGSIVYSLAAGTVIYQSATQNASCSSGWGYDYGYNNTCNMALAIQYYDDDGTPFVVVVGHMIYATTYRSGTGAVPATVGAVTPGQAIGQVARYYNSSGTRISSDHLHFGVFPETIVPTYWGRVSCSTSQTARTSLPSSCTYSGAQATAPGTYIGASGRNWVVPPTAPTLSSPSNGATVTSPVSLVWVNGSGTYRSHVMICTNSSLTSGCLNLDGGMTGMETTGTGATRSTSYRATISTPGTYYWAVRGIAYNDYGGWGSYSTARRFTVL